MYARASQDEGFAADWWCACSRSVLFWVNTCCWTFDPRLTHPVVPFATYEYQDEILLAVETAITSRSDLVLPKSRDMGITWIVLAGFTHRFLFREHQTFLCVSRNEDYVDKPDDPDSLFWKVDFMIARLPQFMKPLQGYQRTHLHFSNKARGCTIDGVGTTGDVGRGGRRTGIMLDEFAHVENPEKMLAATADATRCRIFPSSYNMKNAFWRLTQNTSIKNIPSHWTRHPEKSRGLYTTKNGKIEVLDKTFPFPPDYPWVLGVEGKRRSVWYDAEDRRRSSRREMAQEVDMDPNVGASFFDGDVLTRIETEMCREPTLKGDLKYSTDPLTGKVSAVRGFTPTSHGRLSLWVSLRADGLPDQSHAYVIGADVAAGTGASNSVLSVLDKQTGEKVGEYANPLISPEEFGRFAVALCKFFGGMPNVMLIWEDGGPGAIFGGEVVRVQRYRHIYYRTNQRDIKARVSTKPGWWPGVDSKIMLLGTYRKKLARGIYTNRSREAIAECRLYEYIPGNRVGCAGEADRDDPSGAGQAHGDRVIADALTALLLPEGLTVSESVRKVEVGSPAWRREQVARKKREAAAW